VSGRDRTVTPPQLRAAERGFTLLELVVAMTVLALLSVAIGGVIVLGANSAGSGERVTEQARRLRMATDVITRQIRSTVGIQLPVEEEFENFYFGDTEELEFVTTAPQRADVSGLAVVRYWWADGVVMMSEAPLFAVSEDPELGFEDEGVAMETELLYDVARLTFSYRRSLDDDWQEVWDAVEEDQLPAAVRVEIEPDKAEGPSWLHEVPVMVGVYNEIAGGDSDFLKRNKSTGEGGEQVDPADEEEEDEEGNPSSPPSTQ
jgi:general secretion pathway protein J